MPNQSKALGIVRKIRPKPEGSPYHSNREWDSVLIYWEQGHRMNERWVVRGSLEVISEGR
jgi:hypothetical protein